MTTTDFSMPMPSSPPAPVSAFSATEAQKSDDLAAVISSWLSTPRD